MRAWNVGDPSCHREFLGVRGVGTQRVHLDLHAAQSLGLFPPVPTQHVAFVGNAAGVGAQMALIDARARRRMADLRRRTEFLDLATDKRFLEVFSGRLGFSG